MNAEEHLASNIISGRPYINSYSSVWFNASIRRYVKSPCVTWLDNAIFTEIRQRSMDTAYTCFCSQSSTSLAMCYYFMVATAFQLGRKHGPVNSNFSPRSYANRFIDSWVRKGWVWTV